MGITYRALISPPHQASGFHVEQTFPDDLGDGRAQEIFARQYGVDTLHVSVQRLYDRNSNRSSTSSYNSDIGLVVAAVLYLPIIAPIALAEYYAYPYIKAWHPVYIGLTMIALAGVCVFAIGTVIASMSRTGAIVSGALVYAALAVEAKRLNLYPPSIDWPWVAAIAVICGVLGAPSFGASHNLLVRIMRRNR